MAFWFAASAGFVLLVSLILFGMSVPGMLMGQHPDDFWVREPTLVAVLVACAITIPIYLGFITWLDRKCRHDQDR